MDGAQEFATYFAQQVNYAFRTANRDPILQLSDPTCPACQGLVRDIDAMRGRGNYVDGDVWLVQSSIAQSFDSVSNAVVILEIHQTDAPIKDSSGNVADRYQDESAKLALTLVHDGNTWRVGKLQVSK